MTLKYLNKRHQNERITHSLLSCPCWHLHTNCLIIVYLQPATTIPTPPLPLTWPCASSELRKAKMLICSTHPPSLSAESFECFHTTPEDLHSFFHALIVEFLDQPRMRHIEKRHLTGWQQTKHVKSTKTHAQQQHFLDLGLTPRPLKEYSSGVSGSWICQIKPKHALYQTNENVISWVNPPDLWKNIHPESVILESSVKPTPNMQTCKVTLPWVGL